MATVIKPNHKNRYWEIDETSGVLVGKLHFKQFYEDEVILSFMQDEHDDTTFWYASDMLEVEDDLVCANDPDEAMAQFEQMVIEHIEDEINGLEEMKERFLEVD